MSDIKCQQTCKCGRPCGKTIGQSQTFTPTGTASGFSTVTATGNLDGGIGGTWVYPIMPTYYDAGVIDELKRRLLALESQPSCFDVLTVLKARIYDLENVVKDQAKQLSGVEKNSEWYSGVDQAIDSHDKQLIDLNRRPTVNSGYAWVDLSKANVKLKSTAPRKITGEQLLEFFNETDDWRTGRLKANYQLVADRINAFFAGEEK